MPSKKELVEALEEAIDRVSEMEAQIAALAEDNESLRLALSEGGAGTPAYIRYAGTGQVEGGWASPGLVRKSPPMGALCVSHVVIDEATYKAAPAHQKFGVRVKQAPMITKGKRL